LKLTNTLDEHEVLERLIEHTKPPIPEDCTELHYLLLTPFRYGPYPHDSRFRRSGEFSAGVFYGAEVSETAIAEFVFHRLRFFAESPDTPWPANPIDCRAFATEFAARLSIDLSKQTFNADRERWTHPSDYSACLLLADEARNAGIEVIRYESVRDPLARANLALLTPAVLALQQRFQEETWLLHFGNRGVRAICENPRRSLEFDARTFESDLRTRSWRWER
jgi:hypothetical protein